MDLNTDFSYMTDEELDELLLLTVQRKKRMAKLLMKNGRNGMKKPN